MSLAEKKVADVVVLNRLNIVKAPVILIGDEPLLMNNWSTKAINQMLGIQTGKATKQREKKDPEAQYLGSLHYCSDGPTECGFPAGGVKKCAVRGAKEVPGLDMTKARTSFFVKGDSDNYVPIYGKHEKHQAMVRIQQTTDIRFRGVFKEWATKFMVEFNADVISYDQIVNILEYGGFGCGIGEWRPEKGGVHGKFHIGTEEEFAPYVKKYSRKSK